ncbi:MFS transporter [Psychrobacillus lasiicapitis]|uniref:MFS transporter n=1 Tax=Psychrobacillus lasiicapitis TaxID=1636719 RepID=A0A544SX21_9BACI|nr:MFS transporter [Psychrobacillus lasiicapitis]TQR09748.1 MFS transporter [Psychrobacillus lasiicapitis]GGA23154.1 MFS transporter [Psychrobacillus lasiicapitis]
MNLRGILLLIFLFQTIINATRPVITLSADELGASIFLIGILTSSFAFLPLIFSIHAGKIIDKFGNRMPIIFGFVVSIVGMIIPTLYSAVWSLFASQLLLGLANICIPIALQNQLGHQSTPKNRDYFFSMFSLCVALGAVIGPLVGGYLSEHISFQVVYIFCIVVGVISIVFSFGIPKAAEKISRPPTKLVDSFKLFENPLVRKALFSSALVLYSKDIFVAYFPLLGKQMHLSTSAIGWIIALQGLATMFVRFILPKLLETYKRDTVLFMSILVAGIAFLLLPFSHSVYLIALLAIGMGLGLGCGQPISMTTTYNASPPDRTGEVLGLRIATNRFSQLIAPTLFGVIGGSIGMIGIFLFSGVFLVGGSLFFRKHEE